MALREVLPESGRRAGMTEVQRHAREQGALARQRACRLSTGHEWLLRSIEFEDFTAVRTFECALCGSVDYRD